MKNIFRILAVLLLILSVFIIHSCKKDKPTPPIITTIAVTEISYTTATSGGDLTNEGGAPIISRGVCWNTSAAPTITNSKTTESGGSGSFTSNIAQLTPNTLYYVRAYATNIAGTGYVNQVSFTTSQIALATLTTTAITTITQTSAVSGGNISSDGGETITARGVCWSTNPNPTVLDSKTSNGTGTGSYISAITGLLGNTIYYVRAYATNSVGTAYGTEITFILWINQPGPQVNDINGNTYNSVKIGNQVWMAENLKTTKYFNNIDIPLVNTTVTWDALTTTDKAYCWYSDNISNKDTYGEAQRSF